MIEALRAIRDGDAQSAEQLAGGYDSLLGNALSAFLRKHPQVGGSVYTEPAAFQAFIAGGGNTGLYGATAGALAAAHERERASSVLDIGCGDGAALVPALARTADLPSRLDLVELSPALLDTAVDRLRAFDIDVTTHATTAQQFASGLTPEQQWDVAESTFALHTLPAGERDQMLRDLHGHVRELVVVEFDVPDHEPGTDEHLRFLAESYEQGLHEYDHDRELVAEGFLMPVLVGQLAPGAARMTHEQPADAWAEQVRRCGYTDVVTSALYPYWSSPAFVLTARGGAAD